MNRIQTFVTIMLSLSVGIVLAACGNSDAKTNQSAGAKEEQAVTVRVQEVQSAPFTEILPVTGIVKAYEDVMLSPEDGGVVKEWKVEKGERVTKGQLLAILKDDVLQASYDAALAQYKLAELNFSKQEKVFSEQAISELQLKSSQYNRDAAKAQADLMLARLERAKLRSPINGILDDRLADEGEFAPTGVPVAHIVNIGLVKIVAEVPEKYSGAVSVGAQVRVTVEAIGSDTLSGKVNFVGAAVSANNRTLPAEIVIPNTGYRLKPEMVARVQIVRSKRQSAILISDNIVQQVDRNKMVVYVEKNGRAEERVVKIGARHGNMLEVVDGLKSGDRVIVSGFQKLVNGQAVQVAS